MPDPYALGFEIVNTPAKNITMAFISPEEQAFQRDVMIAARKAGSPYISGRTFEARDHPKGSEERARLNLNPITSDRKTDRPFVIIRNGAEPEYFGRWALANRRLGQLIRPHMPPRVPLPKAPPAPSGLAGDLVIEEGEYAGMTMREAHEKHFDPAVSDTEFLEKRKVEIDKTFQQEVAAAQEAGSFDGLCGAVVKAAVAEREAEEDHEFQTKVKEITENCP